MGVVRLDLHVHSRHSPDSALSIGEVVARLPLVGLNGFALTDHNSVAGHGELAEAQAKHPEIVLVPGVEISTREGHLLAYAVSEVPPEGRPVAEVIDWVRFRGGVPVLSHPFRLSHGVGRAVAESAPGVAIETVNGHNSPLANRRAAAVAVRRRLVATGGSDVHDLSDLGRAYSEFADGTATVDAVLRSLAEGKVTAGGRGLSVAEWLRYEWRTAVLRAKRGFRPI